MMCLNFNAEKGAVSVWDEVENERIQKKTHFITLRYTEWTTAENETNRQNESRHMNKLRIQIIN